MNNRSIIRLLIFLMLFSLSAGVYAQQTMPKIEFVELGYGIYTSQTVAREAMATSPSGTHDVMEKQVLVKKTVNVPAKLHVQVGTIYKLKSDSKDTARIEIEWIFPREITDPVKHTTFKNIRYPIEIPLNFENSSCYSLDNNFEVVKGTWLCNIYYNDKVIYTKKFVLF